MFVLAVCAAALGGIGPLDDAEIGRIPALPQITKGKIV